MTHHHQETPEMRTEKLINLNKLELTLSCVVALVALGGLIGSVFVLPGRVNEMKADVQNIQQNVQKLTLDTAVNNSSRFTVNDWSTAKSTIDGQVLQLDKRVTRSEDNITAIKQSLDRIEQKLDRMDKKP